MQLEIGAGVDFCDQHEIRGWTNAPSLDVYVSGECAGSASFGELRADGAGEGLAGVRAFHFAFSSPLWLEDRVTLRLSNNRLVALSQDASHLNRLLLLVSYQPP